MKTKINGDQPNLFQNPLSLSSGSALAGCSTVYRADVEARQTTRLYYYHQLFARHLCVSIQYRNTVCEGGPTFDEYRDSYYSRF